MMEYKVTNIRILAYECWKRNNIANNRYFIRVKMPGKREQIICFKDSSDMTIKNVLYIIRFHSSIYNDELYVANEHGNELTNCTVCKNVQM